MARFRLIHSAASIIVLTGCAGAGEGDADPLPFFGNLNVGGAQNSGFAGATSAGNNGGAASAIGGGGSGQGTQQTGGASNVGSGNGGSGQSGNSGINGSGGLGSGGTGNGSGGVPGGGGAPGGGGFVSVDVNGGASAAFVCPPGPFGSPLAGMGQVQTIEPPDGNFFSFTEGPVWIGGMATLFFSDHSSPERIFTLTAPFTTPSVFIDDSGSNGLAIDSQDQLVVADQARNRVVRLNPATEAITGTIAPVGNYNPNDVIVRSDGNVYFTDANEARAFYRVSPAGQLSGPFNSSNATNAPANPNGILLSPDENTLYVSNVFGRTVSAFRLLADGAVDPASGVIFASDVGNTADGMAVDCAGNLYVGTDSGVEVYSPAGSFIGDVPTGYASNCTFGGADRRTLFVTSQGLIKSVTLGVPGLPD